jgi:SAM-dependent methyltransferase
MRRITPSFCAARARRWLRQYRAFCVAVTDEVAVGYDAVYASWSSSPMFHDLWARHAVDGEMPDGFEHLNFARIADIELLRDALDLEPGDRFVDLACGAGGPGAWIARQTQGVLVGVDLSRVGTRIAAERAAAHRLVGATFVVGSVDHLPIVDGCLVGAMSLDSLQYVPDKRTTFTEVVRALVPGGRFAFTAFELDGERVRDVPVLGVDPVGDYSVLLENVGFTVVTYDETPGWHERLVAAYSAVVASEPTLRPQMGDSAVDALLLEMLLTLQIEPYRRRVFAVATRD